MAEATVAPEGAQNGTHALPATIKVDPRHPPKHTPREMQLVESFLGKNAEAMTIGEGEQAIAFFALRRLGHDPTWEQAGDVFVEAETPNPREVAPAIAPSTSLLGSVGIGA